MPWWDIVWTDEVEAHIAPRLSFEDIENALCNPIGEEVSESTGRPICFGYAMDGRKIAVVYEKIDDVTIYPITAYEVR